MHMKSILPITLALALVALTAVDGRAQDIGVPDTISVDSILVRSGGSHAVPINFANDQSVSGFEITIDLVDSRLAVDSFAFSGGRVAYLNTRGYYTSGTNVSIWGIVLAEQLIAPGSGLLGRLYVSVPADVDTFAVVLDSNSYFDNGALHTTFFSSEDAEIYYPVFEAGMLDIRVGGCCFGLRGDVDGDGQEDPGPVDLATLVDFLFQTPPDLACPEEADINGDGEVGPLDLATLVDYLFAGIGSMIPCP